MKARYNRISTANQNLERQLVKQNPDEVLFNDVVSGSVAFGERTKGKELIDEIEAGNINYVVVSSIDRLGRNLFDIVGTLEYFNSKGVVLRVDNLGLESMVMGKVNPTFNLIISVMANVAQMERETLLERQKEGIAIAKAKGVYNGRVKGSTESDAEVLSKYKEVVKFLKMGKSLRDIKSRCEVSLGTVQKVKQILSKNTVLS
ncbi:recombinase family protein [Flavobacterium sp. M31R6]|uniref:recombinase family protein n=1 Tax=Flavobacterium sp. M31R6 TaxID=2739062 RepID=UPI0015688F22|nr:recombinase family protein [Flavobacterium sp. M31R6]QKJ61610.1 recombinase family protein [Flavobacterium sp. M31R6]